MSLDDELEQLEESGETEAELIDQESELEDYESDDDQLFDEDATEEDYEHAYENFMTSDESDYNGWREESAEEALTDEELAEAEGGEGFHVIDREDLRDEVVEMEIDEDDIEAYLEDEDGNEIGFVILDEDGNEVEYYYADEDEDEIADALNKDKMGKAVSDAKANAAASGTRISKEEVKAFAGDLKAIAQDGAEVVGELKDAFDDISDTLSFLKPKKGRRR